jgi:hypothetical protein
LQPEPDVQCAFAGTVRVHAYGGLISLKDNCFAGKAIRRRCFGRGLADGEGRQKNKNKKNKAVHVATDMPQAAYVRKQNCEGFRCRM